MEQEKIHHKQGNPERQAWYVLIYKILVIE